MTNPAFVTTPITDERYREAAKKNWCSDELEIDPEAMVSSSDSGAWVHAWVWVSSDESVVESITIEV